MWNEQKQKRRNKQNSTYKSTNSSSLLYIAQLKDGNQISEEKETGLEQNLGMKEEAIKQLKGDKIKRK